MTEEFRDDIRAAIQKHSHDLNADDLRDLASDIESTADNWEGVDI